LITLKTISQLRLSINEVNYSFDYDPQRSSLSEMANAFCDAHGSSLGVSLDMIVEHCRIPITAALQDELTSVLEAIEVSKRTLPAGEPAAEVEVAAV